MTFSLHGWVVWVSSDRGSFRSVYCLFLWDPPTCSLWLSVPSLFVFLRTGHRPPSRPPLPPAPASSPTSELMPSDLMLTFGPHLYFDDQLCIIFYNSLFLYSWKFHFFNRLLCDQCPSHTVCSAPPEGGGVPRSVTLCPSLPLSSLSPVSVCLSFSLGLSFSVFLYLSSSLLCSLSVFSSLPCPAWGPLSSPTSDMLAWKHCNEFAVAVACGRLSLGAVHASAPCSCFTNRLILHGMHAGHRWPLNWGERARGNGWSRISEMVSNTSNTWFQWFPGVWCHSICSVPAIIMSHPPLSSLLWCWGMTRLFSLPV